MAGKASTFGTRHTQSPFFEGIILVDRPVEPFDRLVRILAGEFSLEREEVTTILAPLRSCDRTALDRFVMCAAYALFVPTLDCGDGGSSPLAASTDGLPHCPPAQPDVAEVLRQKQEAFLRRRRFLRELAVIHGLALQKQGTLLGRLTAPLALEFLRFALLADRINTYRMSKESTVIPSRVSIGAVYFFLMLLRRHDPAFGDWEGVFAPSLAALTLPVESGISSDLARLPNPVIALEQVAELVRGIKEKLSDRQGADDDDEATTDAAGRQDLSHDGLMYQLLLAGMVLEHGCTTVRHASLEAAHSVPRDQQLSLSGALSRRPVWDDESMSVWDMWGALLESVLED